MARGMGGCWPRGRRANSAVESGAAAEEWAAGAGSGTGVHRDALRVGGPPRPRALGAVAAAVPESRLPKVQA